jgi:hypothetical protein
MRNSGAARAITPASNGAKRARRRVGLLVIAWSLSVGTMRRKPPLFIKAASLPVP